MHFVRTNSLLERLLGFTVARGGLVTIAQSLVLILYVVQPTKLNWMPVHFMLAKLSIITMIAILNSRESLRRQGMGKRVGDTMLSESIHVGQLGANSTAAFQFRSLGSPSQQRPDASKGVHVHRDQITDYNNGGGPVAY
ncbi:hypothetical protein C8R43DRAFT_1186563 [Mycena crocata]|nr:hypothetical protein C8R43DRAFT_1186563 [Mycena crocata]